jgi:hypothetical protein
LWLLQLQELAAHGVVEVISTFAGGFFEVLRIKLLRL